MAAQTELQKAKNMHCFFKAKDTLSFQNVNRKKIKKNFFKKLVNSII